MIFKSVLEILVNKTFLIKGHINRCLWDTS